jgi:predicted  nucleic acid-binding Zn-ribbon protein
MATAGQTLRELHRLHRLVRDLKAEIDKGPRLIKSQQAKLARAEVNLHDSQNHLKQLKVTVRDKEASLKSTHQQIAKYEKQQNEVASKKEFEALQHEITHCRESAAKLEDEILSAMSEIDETTPKVPAMESALKQVQAETAGFELESRQRIERLSAELATATAQLVAAEESVPSDIRPSYDRLVAAQGADAIAAVQDKTCMTCYSTVTPQQLRELEAGAFSACKNCGRLLYLAR